MSELSKLMEYLADPAWIKQEVLPKLAPGSFEEIYRRTEMEEDGGCPGERIHNYDPFDRKGLKLGEFKPESIPSSFKPDALPEYIEVYLLDSGEIALIQTTTTSWDSGKSISCYGQWGKDEVRRILIADRNSISPYSKEIANMVAKEVERVAMICQRIQEGRYNHSWVSWEGECNRLYDMVQSYKDLKELIQNGDVNQKILTMEYIAPLVVDLLSKKEIEELYIIVRGHLSNDCMCTISYSAPQSDEEDTRTISGAAGSLIGMLELYAKKR